MESKRGSWWLDLAVCTAVAAAWVVAQLVPNRPDYAGGFAPGWLALVAAGVIAAGLVPWSSGSLQRGLRWAGLLLMVWVSNGLPFDLLRAVGLIPLGVDWPGLVIRAFAIAAAVVLARPLLSVHPGTASAGDSRAARGVNWFGYAALACALTYPVLRTIWAFGGTLGLEWPGAAGEGFLPWLASIPWWMAAALSLMLVATPRWMPRRLLLAGGWFATAVVAMVGPAAVWSLVSTFAAGRAPELNGIAAWVPCLFYGSWLLWAIAGGAATRTYQLRSAATQVATPA